MSQPNAPSGGRKPPAGDNPIPPGRRLAVAANGELVDLDERDAREAAASRELAAFVHEFAQFADGVARDVEEADAVLSLNDPAHPDNFIIDERGFEPMRRAVRGERARQHRDAHHRRRPIARERRPRARARRARAVARGPDDSPSGEPEPPGGLVAGTTAGGDR